MRSVGVRIKIAVEIEAVGPFGDLSQCHCRKSGAPLRAVPKTMKSGCQTAPVGSREAGRDRAAPEKRILADLDNRCRPVGKSFELQRLRLVAQGAAVLCRSAEEIGETKFRSRRRGGRRACNRSSLFLGRRPWFPSPRLRCAGVVPRARGRCVMAMRGAFSRFVPQLLQKLKLAGISRPQVGQITISPMAAGMSSSCR